MISLLTLQPISLLLILLISISFVASFDLDQQEAGELFPSFGAGIAAEPQKNEGNNGLLELIASNNIPTTLTTTGGKYSEFATHKCSYNNPNQPSSRRARSKRGEEVCVPSSRDDHDQQSVQDNVQAQPEEEKGKPQESAQPPDVSPVYEQPLAPYKDKLLCPIPRAPWPVCGTVDSFYIHHQIIYPVMSAPIGWWIHEYCVPGVYLYSSMPDLVRLH